MAKFYSENSKKETNNLEPRKEAVDFILSYSKALYVVSCKNIEFEAILN